ncbi:MAG: DUF3810 family protein [Meiothermus sp.]|nr:DUF3810 family protein [Meiothermus sp.]
MAARLARGFTLLLGVLVVGFALLWAFAPPGAEWIERHYSRGFYPWLASGLVPLAGAVPFSLAALVVVLVPAGWAVWSMGRLRRRRLLEWLGGSALLVATVYALFVLVWGANYGRLSIEAQMGLAAGAQNPQELGRLVERLGTLIARSASAKRDSGAARAALRASLVETVRGLTGVAPTLPDWPKTLPPGSLIRLGNASGVVSPITLEAHLDGALWEPFELAIGAHELAHIAGYAREADADLVAALAGLAAHDPYARYATALKLWAEAARQLPPERYAAALRALPGAARADLEASRAVFVRYRLPEWVRNLQTQLYDRYLTSQGVGAGVGDYSRTIGLLLDAVRQGRVRLEP